MREVRGNLFTQDCDAICVTTNGIVKANGQAVMGAGVAKTAADLYPALPFVLGRALKDKGNRLHLLTKDRFTMVRLPEPDSNLMQRKQLRYDIVALPTKQHWRNNSDINLITVSIQDLILLTDKMGWKRVVMPPPGCGLGGLSWEDTVKPRLSSYLDDRFEVIFYEDRTAAEASP